MKNEPSNRLSERRAAAPAEKNGKMQKKHTLKGSGSPARQSEEENRGGAVASATPKAVKRSVRDPSLLRKTVIAIEGRPTEDPYYLKISKSFRTARFIIILLLILFVLSMLTVYSSEITVENFKYLMKYMDINLITSPDEFKDLNYESGAKMDFGFYQGNFVAVRENGLSVYDQFANTVLETSHSMVSPYLTTSEKYILVFDRGSYTYSLMNSFSVLYTGSTEYPIAAGDVCDEGSSVIVSRNLSYLSVVSVYDSNFNLVGQLQKDKYVTSVDLSENGEKLAVLSMFGDNDGRYCGELQIYNVKKGEIEATVDYFDTLPLKVQFLSDGKVCVLFSDEFRFYTPSLEPAGAVAEFDGKAAKLYAIGDRFCAVAVSETGIGYQSKVNLFDTEGKPLAEYRVSGQLTKMTISGDRFYLLTTDRLYTGGLTGALSYIDVEKDGLDVFANESGEMLFLCYSNRARVLDPATAFSAEKASGDSDV